MTNGNNNFPNYQYADLLKNPNTFLKIEDVIRKHVEMTNTLVNMMTLLVSKLCKQVSESLFIPCTTSGAKNHCTKFQLPTPIFGSHPI